jgi:Tfp pilus assembly protein PilF
MQITLSSRIFVMWLTVVSAGCSTTPDIFKSKSERELQIGIKSYEDGDYKTAAKQLQTSIDMGLESKSDQGNAHKYLAFIDCTSGREKACRDQFRKAFDSDPKFDLKPAEAGHPIWGPVFRGVKAEAVSKAKSK